MDLPDSAVDRVALGRARALLKAPLQRERVWPCLAAAALAAISALAFATAMVMAPPTLSRPMTSGEPLSVPARDGPG